MSGAPHGALTLVRQRQLRIGFFDLARQTLARKSCVRDQAGCFGIADEVNALDSVRLPLALPFLEAAIQAVVRMTAGDQHQRIEFHPSMALVRFARQMTYAPVGALRT